jgi:protein-disulfide isomerase
LKFPGLQGFVPGHHVIMRRMLTQSTRKKRNSLSPYTHLFIPIAFILGLGGGYLLWGRIPSTVTANTSGIQRVSVSTDGEPSIGPEGAPVTIVEFSDYQCPYCQKWYHEVFDQLLASYPGKIRFVYRDLPLPMHSEAIPAAEAADCAGEQGAYWKFHDALFSGQYTLGRSAYEQYAADLGLDTAAFTACLDDHRYQAEVQADASDATRLGLTGTPSFFINGRVIIGALPFENFKAIIDEELALQR